MKAEVGERRVVIVASVFPACEGKDCCSTEILGGDGRTYPLGYNSYLGIESTWDLGLEDNSVLILECTEDELPASDNNEQIWKIIEEENGEVPTT